MFLARWNTWAGMYQNKSIEFVLCNVSKQKFNLKVLLRYLIKGTYDDFGQMIYKSWHVSE